MDIVYSPYYMEDVDLSVRAWRKGWKCYYEQDAICYHKLSETIANHNTKKQVRYISKRNKYIFHHIHLIGTKRLLWNLENMVNIAFRWLAWDWSFYRSYFEYEKLTRKKNTNTYLRSMEEITDEILNASKGREKELF